MYGSTSYRFPRSGRTFVDVERQVTAFQYIRCSDAELGAAATTWKWRARAETVGTTVKVGNLAIAVLQLEATPAAARRRYMALAG
jgi:hypothetical protein